MIWQLKMLTVDTGDILGSNENFACHTTNRRASFYVILGLPFLSYTFKSQFWMKVVWQ